MTFGGRVGFSPNSYIEQQLGVPMPSGLDNPQLLARIDARDMLGAIYRFADPFLGPERFQASEVQKVEAANGLVFVGMGGSASAGDVLLDWLRDEFKTYALVSREPRIPKFVDEKTLVVCFSYSGETWETLQAFEEASRRGCRLAAVGSGGRLGKACEARGVPFFQVDSGQAPRAALGQMIVAGSRALQRMGAVGGVRQRLLKTGKELAELRENLKPNVSSSDNKAKEFAFLLKGKMPAIYAFQRMSSVARRFKNQLAENSKVVAKYELLPEAAHNEVESWRSPDQSYLPLFIRDSQETAEEEMLARAFKLTIAGAGKTRPLEVRLRAETELGRLLAPILFLDYVSCYLALLRKVDPSPTLRIREYKRRYKQSTPRTRPGQGH